MSGRCSRCTTISGLPQAEIARILELHPRKVSYLWIAATENLAGELGQVGGF